MPQTHAHAAHAALLEGDTAKANVETRLALQDDPLDARSHLQLGCLLEREGQSEQATVGFERAVALDPTNADALYDLGTLLLRQGEAVPAARALERAVSIRPDHVASYNNLAKAYYLAGLPELAVATYEEALRRDPSNAVALKNLLLLAQAAGFRDAAATYRQRLETLESGRDAASAGEAGARSAMSPVWPLAIAANDSASTTSSVGLAPEQPAASDADVDALRALLRDLPHVTVERRAGRLTVAGWTSGAKERALLDRILGKPSDVLDLTGDDSGDPQRMIEVDAVLFIMRGLNTQDVGFDFLKQVDVTFNYFASFNNHAGTGYSAPPKVTGPVTGLTQQGWIFGASVDYVVNIANASDERVAVLARPHLTALSGTAAKFLAGGELIYRVSGLNSGDIRPYPFGTTLAVTPTLLRTPAENGVPRVHLGVEAGRTSILSIINQDPNVPSAFDKVTISSEAVLTIGETLILSGLSQRESHATRSGVPLLMDIPILKYLFSTESSLVSDSAVVILLTPRDPAFLGEQNRRARAEFVEKRTAFVRARQGTPQDMQRFRERYPDWDQLPPNRFASHFFLMESSELYRAASGQDLESENLDLELLGPKGK